MNSSTAPFLFISLLFLISSTAAFNITKILDQYPDFSNFNSFLTKTHLADEINHRQTITVLAVDNGAVSSLSGQPDDVLKRIMSVHVVLDYYDMDKLKNLKKKSTLLTTLFQSSGLASNQQGFLNITILKSGDVKLGSASPGAGLTANLVGKVAAQPYNISVLQISSVIVPLGIDKSTVNKTMPPSPPPRAGSPKKAPTPEPSSEAPTPDAPASVAPEANGPASDDKSDSPVSSPPNLSADGPAASNDSSAPGPSDASRSSVTTVAFGTFSVAMGVVCMASL